MFIFFFLRNFDFWSFYIAISAPKTGIWGSDFKNIVENRFRTVEDPNPKNKHNFGPVRF